MRFRGAKRIPVVMGGEIKSPSFSYNPPSKGTAGIEVKSSSSHYDHYKNPWDMEVIEEDDYKTLVDDFGYCAFYEDFRSMRDPDTLQENQQAPIRSSDKIPFCSGFHDEETSLDDNYHPEFATLNGNNPDVNIKDDLTKGPTEFTAEFDMKRGKAYREVIRSYHDLHARLQNLSEAKSKILSYVPGAWIDNNAIDYVIPRTTTLLLIGPKGSGKSSLVNRITRVFEDDKFASERAQVSYNSSVRDGSTGTSFLQECMIPRNADRFCLFDTRSLSDDGIEMNLDLHRWLTEGVSHGELVTRSSDSPSLSFRLKCKARNGHPCLSKIRKVNFVIFVVSGLSVLQSLNSDRGEGRQYTRMLTEIFDCLYLPFNDDMPAVVVTHGDMLSLHDRARVRVYLGELLGVPPTKQIFDIPEDSEPTTELAIVDMIRYCLEHADRNLPHKSFLHWLLLDKIYYPLSNDMNCLKIWEKDGNMKNIMVYDVIFGFMFIIILFFLAYWI